MTNKRRLQSGFKSLQHLDKALKPTTTCGVIRPAGAV
jgi:hypothetical protein